MPKQEHYQQIYAHRASAYHQLISLEDADDNLLPALERITPLKDKHILDLATGAGRFPLLYGSLAKPIICLTV